jgi:hypothetical protein
VPEPNFADAVAITNVTLSGVQTINGVSGVAGTTRILAPNQTTATEVGIWVMQTGAWTRAPDFDTGAEMPFNQEIVIKNGSQTWDGSVWYVANDSLPVVGTDPITIRCRSFGQALGAGAGMSQGVASLSQATTGITPGTYDRLTVNATGHATAGATTGESTTAIEGLGVVRVSGTAFSVLPGNAWVPGAGGTGRVVSLSTTEELTGLTLSANTTYSLYLFESGGIGEIEYATQAPAAPYLSDARVKGPDASPINTHRYIGWLTTDASGNIVEVGGPEKVGGPASEPWIAPTLLNSWVNFSPPGVAPAGYRKTPEGEDQLRGMIKNGTTTAGTVLFTLPAGYRPSSQRNFPAVQGGNAACRIYVQATGDVTIEGVTNNAFLSPESVRFDAV